MTPAERIERSHFEVPPGYEVPAPKKPERNGKHGGETVIARVQSMDWRDLASKEPPQRDWVLESWISSGNATLVAGQGGIGKTLLMQTVGTALALGHDYIDSVPRARRVLFWAGEDDEAELWRRQLAICRPFGIELEQLPKTYQLKSYAAHDITLAGHAFGKLDPTRMMQELREQIGDYRADVVVLDSVARVYGGSENDRHEVTTFISWLASACAPTNAAMILIGHPGKAMGAEFSGSTAWEASVRSRLYFGATLPNEQPDDDDAPDETLRYLCRRKANYSAKDFRRLHYRDGVFVPEERQQERFTGNRDQFAGDVVLSALRKLQAMSEAPTGSRSSPSYLPKLAKRFGLLDGITEAQFRKAMDRLRTEGKLSQQVVGQYSNRTPKLGLVEVPS